MVFVESCISIDIPMLRGLGLLSWPQIGGVSQSWRAGGDVLGKVWLAVEQRGGSPVVTINGECFGRQVRQAVPLAKKPCRFGGIRFFMVCEATGGSCLRLILPPGGSVFCSVRGSGVSYKSQSENAATRAYKAASRVERKIAGLSPRAHAATRCKLAMAKAERDAYISRLDKYVHNALADGRQFSVRKAARWAKNPPTPQSDHPLR